MCEWLWRLLCIHVVMLLFSALELFQVHRLNAPRFPLASSDTALASLNEMSVFTLALSLFRSPGPLQSVCPLVIHRSGFAPCRSSRRHRRFQTADGFHHFCHHSVRRGGGPTLLLVEVVNVVPHGALLEALRNVVRITRWSRPTSCAA